MIADSVERRREPYKSRRRQSCAYGGHDRGRIRDDGQFDDCDIRFADLRIVAEVL